MELLKQCPYLIPQNNDRTFYHGFFKVNSQSFEIAVQLTHCNSLKGASVLCDWKLKNILKESELLLHERLEQCSDLNSFMVELKSLVERQMIGHSLKQDHKEQPSYYSDLVSQLEQLGWHRLEYIDVDLQELHLVCEDENHRKHTLHLKLHSQHPAMSPECHVDLPDKFELVWTEKSTLKDICHQVEQTLAKYQELWNVLDEIDKATWVLEPENPSMGTTYRRIALGNNASIQITVDTKCPQILPECRFLGADHVVNPLRDCLNKNLDLWDVHAGLLHNLQTMLEIDFPSKQTTTKEELSVECGICYTYRLEGVIPDQVCDDPRCGQPFHQTCLYEWLRAVPSSRQSFNVIFGECPYCSKPITVKMPT